MTRIFTFLFRKCFFFVYGIVYGLIASLGMGFFSVALAANDMNDMNVEAHFFGELDITSEINFLPTGQRGNTAFRIPQLKLGSELLLQNGNSVQLLLEGAEKRDSSSNRFDVQVKETYLNLVSPFGGIRNLRYGLIPNSWQERQREIWNFDYLGSLGKSFTQRNGYISYSDLGLMYISELPADHGEWSASISNGEGLESDEIGPRKDLQLFINWTSAAPVYLAVGYIYGSYDQYDSTLGRKERILLQIVYENENDFVLGLELMDAHDPADIFSVLKMAQGVDLISHAGENIHGQGGSFFTKFYVADKAQVVLRYEILQALVGDKDKRLQTGWAGLTYQFDQDIEATAAYSYVSKPENYGLGNRDESAFEVATRILF